MGYRDVVSAALASRHEILRRASSVAGAKGFDAEVTTLNTLVYAPVFFVDEKGLDRVTELDTTDTLRYVDKEGPHFALPFSCFNMYVSPYGTRDYVVVVQSLTPNEVRVRGVFLDGGKVFSIPAVMFVDDRGVGMYSETELKSPDSLKALGLVVRSALTAVIVAKEVMFCPSKPKQQSLQRVAKTLPFYEYRLVKLNEVRELPAPPRGGHHASPRWHRVRGHWRSYKSGKRVFVRECERGDKAKGVIEKDYTT